MPVKLMTIGEWLCHYTSADAAFRAILPSGSLRMSPYSRMRDPLENKELPPITFDGFEQPGVDMERAFFQAMSAIAGIRDGMRLLSLTLDTPDWDAPFGCAWARARMWEQYADNHHGACLVFRRDAFITQVRAEMENIGSPLLLWGPVEYTSGGFAGSPARHLNAADFSDPDRIADAATKYIDVHHREFFFLKTADWQTEFEYRFALLRGQPDEVQLRYATTLAAVIVGEKFPDWQLAGARAQCEAAGVELYRLDWKMGKPYPYRPRASADADGVSGNHD